MTAVTQTGFRNNIRKYLDAVEREGTMRVFFDSSGWPMERSLP